MAHEQPAQLDRTPRTMQLAEALPGVVAIGVFLWWAHASGGYFATHWYAGALLLTALLFVVVAAWPALLSSLGGAMIAALAALAGFTAWSYLSISWADVKGDAWDGANRTALYLVAFALFALWRWSVSTQLMLLGGFAVGVCSLGAVSLLAAGRAGDLGAYYNDGRFSAPVGYPNGNAALFLLCFWPALFLASRREVPPAVRPLLLAVAGVVVELAVLAQSRGAGVAFLLVLLVYFGLVPGRTRSLVFLLPIAAAVAIALPVLLDAGSETGEGAILAGNRSASEAIGLSALALLIVGFALTVADNRLEIPLRVRWVAARALAVIAALALLGGTATAALYGDLGDRAADAWNDLNSTNTEIRGSSRLLGGFQSNRRDLWRVALEEFREQPVSGIGAENFAVAYVRERRSGEEPLYPHSFPLQVLVQTGLVGTILMGLFLVSALAAALLARARQRGLGRGVASVAIVVFVSWFVHASIDWFWELPALAAPALSFLALAGSAAKPASARSPAWEATVRAVAAGLAIVFALSFLFPWLAARETRRAAQIWRLEPAAAALSLDRARRLNPLTDQADLTSGSIARRRGDWAAMAAAFERALERNPHSWYSRLQLALARARQGKRAAASTQVELADRLNPNEPAIDLVADRLRRRQPVNVREVAQILLDRHARVTGGEPQPEPTREP
jgi:O-antigen ligase